jgi:hypothetical protein
MLMRIMGERGRYSSGSGGAQRAAIIARRDRRLTAWSTLSATDAAWETERHALHAPSYSTEITFVNSDMENMRALHFQGRKRVHRPDELLADPRGQRLHKIALRKMIRRSC